MEETNELRSVSSWKSRLKVPCKPVFKKDQGGEKKLICEPHMPTNKKLPYPVKSDTLLISSSGLHAKSTVSVQSNQAL
jgi:hypothetical protein